MYIIIVGCGRVGSELANLLSEGGHNVMVIDKNPQAFKKLGGRFNGATFEGNGYEPDILKEAGIEKADAFCSVADGDNTNIMAAQVAKKIFKVPSVIARVYDAGRADFYKSLGLEIISGTVVFASIVRDKLLDERLFGFLTKDGRIRLIEFDINETMAGNVVADVNVQGEFSVICVVKTREGALPEVSIPGQETRLEEGTKVYGVVRVDSIKKIKKAFGVSHRPAQDS